MNLPYRMTVLSGTDPIVFAVPNKAALLGFLIHTALVGTITVKGFATKAGVPTDFIIPIGTVGVEWTLPDPGAVNDAGELTATLSSASDNGKAAMLWRAV